MKFFLFFVIAEILTTTACCQTIKIDSLISRAAESPDDTTVVLRMLDYSNKIAFSDPAKALRVDGIAIDMARRLNKHDLEAEALNSAAEDNHFLGNYAEALKMQFEALQINRQIKNLSGEAETLGLIGILYNELSEYRQALGYLIPADSIYQKIPGIYAGCFVLANIGDAYDSLGIADSALYYIRESYYKYAETDRPHLKSFLLNHIGSVYAQFGKRDSALFFYTSAITNSRLLNDQLNTAMSLKRIADLYSTRGMNDSAIYYAKQSFVAAKSIPSSLHMLRAGDLLAVLYNKSHKPDSVLLYLQTVMALKDSLYGPDKIHKLQVLLLDEQQRQNSIRQQEQDLRNRVKYILLIAALSVFLFIAFILLRANRLKQKTNEQLQQQKIKVEATLQELKSTQAQLIQSEKMASLGELTAGIAHEIQNPLNFINNFSELNKELIEEASQAKAEGNQQELNDLLDTLKENQEKINQHGQRADAIVKGMLQHTRSNTGIKEPSNINALADEYLRLAYHGMRTKDKSFNATLQTDFDNSIGQVNIVPQDIGRVFLNLYNNAFYEMLEKKKSINGDYEPTLILSTIKRGSMLYISVKDNGRGIPKNVIDKIFHPFFTTKPPGQGTGLGLSMSYDIVKAHGGEFTVETKEGECTEFVVRIPVT